LHAPSREGHIVWKKANCAFGKTANRALKKGNARPEQKKKKGTKLEALYGGEENKRAAKIQSGSAIKKKLVPAAASVTSPLEKKGEPKRRGGGACGPQKVFRTAKPGGGRCRRNS